MAEEAAAEVVEASTGPLIEISGKRTSSPNPRGPTGSFNGAADRDQRKARSRIAPVPATARGASTGPLIEISGKPGGAPKLSRASRFNGAADRDQRKGGKPSGHAEAPAAGRAASTGPLIEISGKRRAGPPRPPGRSRFNGAADRDQRKAAKPATTSPTASTRLQRGR